MIMTPGGLKAIQFLKNNILSIITLILLLCFITASIIHNYNSPEPIKYEKATEESTKTEISQNINNNTITIEGECTDVALAAAKGLRSAVSIYCTFTATTGGGSPWNPRPSTQTYYSAASCFFISKHS